MVFLWSKTFAGKSLHVQVLDNVITCPQAQIVDYATINLLIFFVVDVSRVLHALREVRNLVEMMMDVPWEIVTILM